MRITLVNCTITSLHAAMGRLRVITLMSSSLIHVKAFWISGKSSALLSGKRLARYWSNCSDWRNTISCRSQVYKLAQDLHRIGIAHGDLEPRNIARAVLVEMGYIWSISPRVRGISARRLRYDTRYFTLVVAHSQRATPRVRVKPLPPQIRYVPNCKRCENAWEPKSNLKQEPHTPSNLVQKRKRSDKAENELPHLPGYTRTSTSFEKRKP